MNRNAEHSFLLSTARTLGDACHEAGCDEGGKRCPSCILRQLCEGEDRWLVKRSRSRKRVAPRHDA